MAHLHQEGGKSGQEACGQISEGVSAVRGRAVEAVRQFVALSKELGVHRRLVYTWRDQLEPAEEGEGPPPNSREATLRKEVSRLKRAVADKMLEADFSIAALREVQARR